MFSSFSQNGFAIYIYISDTFCITDFLRDIVNSCALMFDFAREMIGTELTFRVFFSPDNQHAVHLVRLDAFPQEN